MLFTIQKRIPKLLGMVAAVCCLCLLAFCPMQTRAEDVTEIRTYEDLLKMADNPDGSYRLMADIDLTGRAWTPVDFRGTLDGNGHALLNLKITELGEASFSTFDGNMVEYETRFSGLFSSLVYARVQDLKLLGLDLDLQTDVPTFAGSIAGYMEDAQITGCTVYSTEMLYSSGRSFGLGGIVGFGNGTIEDTKAETTLVCVDTDVEWKDEQFMGGAYAAGYIDLKGNEIQIEGFDSDHGYVHDGGLIGMYRLYPEGAEYEGYITENTVHGQITFFEDNEDRRAYCEAYIGEIMDWSFAYDDAFDADGFTRNEVFDYDRDLLPHSCSDPQYEQTVVPPTETENGYIEYRCLKDDYTFRADFTPVLESAVPEPQTVESPVPEPETPAVMPQDTGTHFPVLLLGIILLIAVIILILIILLARQTKKLHIQETARRRKR